VQPRVVRISIAPVKGLALLHPDSVELGPRGVVGDRRFWLVDTEDGRLVNGKLHGPLVRVRQEWDEGTRRLALTFPDGARVDGVVELGEDVTPLLWGERHPSRRVLGPWQDALSEYAGRALTVLWADQHAVDRGFHGGVASLVSRASLERLRAEAGSDEPVDGRRFRMLFEIDGVAAHEEDRWLGRHVHVGDATIEVLGEAGRCVITTQNPDTGVTDLDTLGALARYRREGVTAPLPFGIWGSVVTPGRVAVGDPVVPPT
jgi:uncharacterized protein YcbX